MRLFQALIWETHGFPGAGRMSKGENSRISKGSQENNKRRIFAPPVWFAPVLPPEIIWGFT